ncbi:adhesion G protein-coupled receptor E3 isoform X2 [Alligator mississippiensis]|uniref:adhesion G protein-coupled receptor E3 isoform X2 n=1 Tax=Alligator mississippiensis TaxID=8496 RepID=UPI0009074C4B|nr:adhesion G protein-coupled receptor E3 isoform X2 [Alligator mississippiensis]
MLSRFYFFLLGLGCLLFCRGTGAYYYAQYGSGDYSGSGSDGDSDLDCGPNAVPYNISSCVCEEGFVSTSGREPFLSISESSCEEIPFHCRSDLAEDNEYKQKCLSGLYQILPGSKEANFCSLFNTTLNIFKDFFGNTNSTPTLKNTVASFDKVLDNFSVKQMDKKEVASAARMILQGLSSTALEAALASPENQTQTVTTDRMVVQTKLVKEYCGTQTNSLRLDAQKDTIDIHCADIEGSTAVAFISYTDLASVLGVQFFQEKALQREEYARINSRVVSAASSANRRNVSNPVNLTFRHNTDMFPQDEVICVHWNSEDSNGTWSSQGCQCLHSNITHSQCSCHYLASFAILMSPSPIKSSVALSIISYVGLMISLICLILAIVTFLFSHTVKNTSSNFIHLQLSIFLFLADIIFLAGVNQTYNKLLCSIIAGVLHYLFLACFAWMFIEGVNLCLIVRNLKVANYAGAGRHMKICMYAFGCGFPAVIVMVSAIRFPSGYGTPYHCWLRLDSNFKWSFLGPVCTIIMTNFGLFCVTLTILQGHLSSLNTEISTVKNTRLLIFKAVAHLFIMGITWVLGLFQFKELADLMAYLFTILNSIQGAFIFFVHCLLNRKVREEYWNWCKKCRPHTKGKTSISEVSMATLPSSAITDVLQKTYPSENKKMQWE